jgi:hypothetical protein
MARLMPIIRLASVREVARRDERAEIDRIIAERHI